MWLAAELLLAWVAIVSVRHADRKLVAESPGIRHAPRYSDASPIVVRAADRDARASVQWLRCPMSVAAGHGRGRVPLPLPLPLE